MENKEKEYNKYDKEIIDTDEIEGTDIKINPDYYIHKALLKAQDAMSKDDVKEGFFQYRQFIEHIEVLCRSASMLTEDYETSIREFEKSEDYKNTEDKQVKSVKLANKKLGLLMKEVFSTKTATDPLKH